MKRYSIETSDGIALSIEECGPEGCDAILFAHEFGGDMSTWDGAFKSLSESFRCMRFAARGFHPSDVPSELSAYGQDRSTRDLLEVTEIIGLRRFHLVGCSMGSFTALMAAIAAPDAIMSLTLIGCSSGPASAEERRIYLEALSREIALLNDRAGDGAVEWFSSDSAYTRMGQKQHEIWRAYLDRLKSQSVEGARNILNTVHWSRRALVEMRGDIEMIRAPVLVLYGEEDHPLVLKTAPFLRDCLPNCRVMSVPGTGHLVHLEEPELFLDAFVQLSRTTEQPRGGDYHDRPNT